VPSGPSAGMRTIAHRPFDIAFLGRLAMEIALKGPVSPVSPFHHITPGWFCQAPTPNSSQPFRREFRRGPATPNQTVVDQPDRPSLQSAAKHPFKTNNKTSFRKLLKSPFSHSAFVCVRVQPPPPQRRTSKTVKMMTPEVWHCTSTLAACHQAIAPPYSKDLRGSCCFFSARLCINRSSHHHVARR